MISYDSLRDKMKEKGISQYDLIRRWHINPAQITRLKRNESVSPHTIEMFCKILKCEVGDIMRHIPDESVPSRHPRYLEGFEVVIYTHHRQKPLLG